MSLRHISSVFGILMGLHSVSTLAGEGWYAGAGVGWSQTGFELTSESSSPNRATPITFLNFEESTTQNNVIGQVHGGYQWLFLGERTVFSLAAEVFIEFPYQNLDLDTTYANDFGLELPYSFRAKAENVYGISLKPGLFVTNNLLFYLDLGGVYTPLGGIETNLNSPALLQPEGSYDEQNLFGIRAGGGVQFLVTKQFSINLSYARDWYDSFSARRLTSASGSEGDVDATFEEIKFNDFFNERALLDFNYYF